MPTPPFDLSPAPRKGQGAYGLVPGQLGLPDPYADLARRYPGLDQNNAQLSQNIMSELQGELPPDVISAIQDESARFGLTSGMPGSDLARRRGARNLGLTSLGLQQSGLKDYLSATQGIKNTQTLDPALQAEISGINARTNAAPDPEAAAKALEDAFNRASGAGGGPSIYTGTPNLGGTRVSPSGLPGQQPVFTGSTGATGYLGGGGGGKPPAWSFNPAGQGSDWVNAGNVIPLYPGGPTPGGDNFMDDFWSGWDSSFGGGGGSDNWGAPGAGGGFNWDTGGYDFPTDYSTDDSWLNDFYNEWDSSFA